MRSPHAAGLRRAFCVVLLIAAPAWQLEAAAGMARDGAVHHESASAAATHAGVSTGDHGHEDGLPPGQHRHGTQHQHGTLADHCSHAHGFAALSVFEVLFALQVIPHRQVDLTVCLAWSAASQFHPPRA